LIEIVVGQQRTPYMRALIGILHQREGQVVLFANRVEDVALFATMECHDERSARAGSFVHLLQAAEFHDAGR
jgi:hypothetical protein